MSPIELSWTAKNEILLTPNKSPAKVVIISICLELNGDHVCPAHNFLFKIPISARRVIRKSNSVYVSRICTISICDCYIIHCLDEEFCKTDPDGESLGNLNLLELVEVVWIFSVASFGRGQDTAGWQFPL